MNVFTLNIISSPFPRNEILYCDWSLFYTSDYQMQNAIPSLFNVYVYGYVVCMHV